MPHNLYLHSGLVLVSAMHTKFDMFLNIVNPRRACTARVTVVAVSVSHNMPLHTCTLLHIMHHEIQPHNNIVGACCTAHQTTDRCVCLLSHIPPLGLLFIVKMLPCTQRAMKVKKFVAFSLKLFCCRDRALPRLMAIHWVGHFSYREHAAYPSFAQGPFTI